MYTIVRETDKLCFTGNNPVCGCNSQVKRSIMLKMADACQRAGGQASTSATRFHELHVQRHTNVTILFADIVNFTPLSSSLTASDLVKTLNDLFGRFDQIAQVT